MRGLAYKKSDSASRVRKKYGFSLEEAARSHRYTAKTDVFEDKYSDAGVVAWFAKLKKHHRRAELHAVVDGITGSKEVLSKHGRRDLLAGMFKLYERAKACAPLEDFILWFFVARSRHGMGVFFSISLMRSDGTYDEERLANIFRIAVIIDALTLVARRLGRPFNPFSDDLWDGDSYRSHPVGGFKCEELMKRFKSIQWDSYYSDIEEKTTKRLKKLEEFDGLPHPCGSSSRKRPRT